MNRLLIAWRAFRGGDIGPIGWCGQDGYWWTRPCPHETRDKFGRWVGGCGWFDGERVVEREDA